MLKKLDKLLYEALTDNNLIAKKTLESLVKDVEASGESLQNILVKRGLLHENDILNILAEKLKLTCLDLKKISIDKSVLDKVPVKIASYYRFIPVGIKGNVLTIAVASPLDIKIQDEIRTQLGYDIELVLTCASDILEGLKRYYGLAAETLEQITTQKVSRLKVSPPEISQERVEDIEKLAEDASVIKLVNQIILEGWRRRATDIHIEPYRGKVSLRYRIDGLLMKPMSHRR
jgi:type IV pilus assembly protein PilB